MDEIIDARKLILALCNENMGDWECIYEDIKSKKRLPLEVIENTKCDNKYVTIIDKTYPKDLKNREKPPFLLFYRGKYDLLIKEGNRMVIVNDHLSSSYSTDTLISICKELIKQVIFIMRIESKKEKYFAKILVDKGAKIIAILSKGLDNISEEDKELFDELSTKGLIISEYPIGVQMKTRKTELSSLKLAVAIANSVLLGGVTRKSSYYASVGYALANDLLIMSIPFNAGTNYVNNSLIRNGIELVENKEDVIEMLKMN